VRIDVQPSRRAWLGRAIGEAVEILRFDDIETGMRSVVHHVDAQYSGDDPETDVPDKQNEGDWMLLVTGRVLDQNGSRVGSWRRALTYSPARGLARDFDHDSFNLVRACQGRGFAIDHEFSGHRDGLGEALVRLMHQGLQLRLCSTSPMRARR
jgi:hypothetical protein